MSKRTYLLPGSIIASEQKEYTIGSVLGEGATCVVYDASCTNLSGFRHKVRLKECYPYFADISRSAEILIWNSSEEQERCLEKFRASYEKLNYFQNTDQLRNSTVYSTDLFAANNTLYSIMNASSGKTFADDDNYNPEHILKIILALTRTISVYHHSGYLHLDIKPENFLVLPETDELIILFDLDTITSLDNLRNGRITSLSVSREYAPPEQKLRELHKISEATDLYGIGAVLFEKFMGRCVGNEDIGLFADWTFEGSLFDQVNPKFKRQLREIFSKTLSANPKCRYQSAEQLAAALEDAVNTVHAGTPYLLSNVPEPVSYFKGRTEELQTISESFSKGIRNVFLHGMGGIGKSELAKKYAAQQNQYDAVLFLRYDDNLEPLLQTVDIRNFEGSPQEKLSVLKRVLQNQNVLLILDNFDTDPENDEYFEDFLTLSADKLITTRTDMTEYAFVSSVQTEVAELKQHELIALFEASAQLTLSSDDRDILLRILKRIDDYTLLVPILAQQMLKSRWTVGELESHLNEGLQNFADTEKILFRKDGRSARMTTLNMMRAVFRMTDLTPIEKQVLENMYFLRFMKLNLRVYMEH